jgi:phage gp29-like protein
VGRSRNFLSLGQYQILEYIRQFHRTFHITSLKNPFVTGLYLIFAATRVDPASFRWIGAEAILSGHALVLFMTIGWMVHTMRQRSVGFSEARRLFKLEAASSA